MHTQAYICFVAHSEGPALEIGADAAAVFGIAAHDEKNNYKASLLILAGGGCYCCCCCFCCKAQFSFQIDVAVWCTADNSSRDKQAAAWEHAESVAST